MIEHAERVLAECHGNKREAARKLRVAPSTFYGWLDQLRRGVNSSHTMPDMGTRLPNTGTVPNKATNVAKTGTKHCVIPDCQVKPGVPLGHLEWAGKYIAEKQPDVIVCIGDFADMRSLSSYDKGKRAAENARYQADVDASKRGMDLLMEPIRKAAGYSPRLVLTLGNHEDRIDRYAEDNPALDGKVSILDLGFEGYGWSVYPFREVVEIDGVSYCHFFYNPNTGRPYAGENLETRLKTIGMSFTMGHQQGLKTAIRDLANGTRQRGLVCGSFYQHQESYKGPQGNSHWQGIIMKNEVSQGNYDLLEISLGYLRRRYG